MTDYTTPKWTDFFAKRAADILRANHTDPALCGPLAEWARESRIAADTDPSRRDAGVIVSTDGQIVARTFRTQSTYAAPGGTYVATDDAKRLGLAGNILDLAIGQIARAVGRDVYHVTYWRAATLAG